jgi:molybdopterin converting factor small subunit
LEVKVNFYGQFRLLVESGKITLNLEPPVTLLNLINTLYQLYGDKMRRMLLNDNAGKPRLKPEVHIAIKGKNWDYTSDLSALNEVLGENDREIEVFFIPPLQGGKWHGFGKT